MNKHVGPPYSWPKIYAARVSYAANDAHRLPLHGFAAAARGALWGRQTDGQRTRHRFDTLETYAVHVIHVTGLFKQQQFKFKKTRPGRQIQKCCDCRLRCFAHATPEEYRGDVGTNDDDQQ